MKRADQTDHVADLPAVKREIGNAIKTICHLDPGNIQHDFPDLATRSLIEIRIINPDGDAALECRIDYVRTVAGQEEQTVVVVHQTQEDANDDRAVQVLAAFRKEDIRFIQQQNRIPFGDAPEYDIQPTLHLFQLEAQLAHFEQVERTVS